MTCAVLVPDGKIAMGKLSQAVAHGATLIQVEGNFDDCLTVARKLAEAYPVELVNYVIVSLFDDLGSAIKSFKKAMNTGEEEEPAPKQLTREDEPKQ